MRRKFQNTGDEICHHFSLQDPVQEASSSVEILAGKTVKEDCLFGPATSLDSRGVIYPCSQNRCALPCPCRICRKIHPSCYHPEPCSCEECMLNFDDHSRFHSVFHHGCKWCRQMLQIVPHFNFHFVSPEQRRLSVGRDDYDFGSGGFIFAAGGPKLSLDFLDHLKRGVLKRCWLCRECRTVFWTNSQFKSHIQKQHLGLKVFRHVYMDSYAKEPVESGFKCYNCSSIFQSRKSLCRHVKNVHHQTSYDCELCNIGFTRKDALKRHKVVAHPASEDQDDGITKESYKCNLCSSLFSRQDNLTRHLKTKHDTIENVSLPRYQCELCDQKFMKKFNLSRHVRVKHEDMKADSPKCYDCGKSFIRADDLKRHMAIHKSDNGVKCDHCDCTFSEKASLERHKKGAADKDHFAKFVCDDCLKFFCTGKAMQGHKCDRLLVADKPAPIICKKCFEVFTTKRALNVHVKKIIKLSCNQCLMSFCNMKTLNNHILYIHNMESI